jgi:predicted phosphodiesterase
MVALRYPARLLSDLHLGHDICPIASVTELEPLLQNIRTLILNGDTLEARLPSFQSRSRELVSALEARCGELGIDLIMVNGNHDPCAWPHDYLSLATGQVFITHGHVFLYQVSPWSSKLRHCRAEMDAITADFTPEDLLLLEKRFERTRRWSEAMIATEVRQRGNSRSAKLKMALRELWPPSRPWNVAKVWTLLPYIVNRFARQFCPDAKVILFGHTHRAAWWRKDGRLLVNTGGFVSFAKALAVDFPDASQVLLRRIERRQGQYHPGRTVAKEQFPPQEKADFS